MPYQVILLTLLCVFLAVGQTPPAARPKIGIALEGGGALGLGHIGVLEWLEAHHIPIDYVAGTSMGGLVGGLYSAGNDPSEIRRLIREIDWDRVLRGQVPYRDLAYRRKEDSRAYPNYIELGLKDGIALPGGLNSGQQVKYILDRAALPYSDLKSFDDLPIPFRCVATELTTGKEHVFQSGPLAQALRATMSLPALFAPARTADGKVYVDGGLLNNLPVDVVKAMGADIVIAVFLATKPFNPRKTPSLLETLGQSVDVVIKANERRNLEMADILVTVDLDGYSALDYQAADPIADRGVEGAERKSRILSTLALDESTWQRYLADRESRRITTVPVPEFITVEGATPQMRQGLEEMLKPLVGKTLDTHVLERSLTQIIGLGRFATAGYRMAERDGRNGLVVNVEEKTYAPPMLKPGIFVQSSDLTNIRVGVGARITVEDVGGFRAEWRTDFLVGSTYSITSEYFRPLGQQSHWFVAPKVNASTTPADFYQANRRLAEYRIRQAGVGADLGYLFGRSGEVRVGYQMGYRSAALRIGSPELPTVSGRYGATVISWAHDRLDSPLIPREGRYVTGSLQMVDTAPGSSGSFRVATVDGTIFRRVSLPASVFFGASGGTTFGNRETGLPQFFLGGPLRMGAYGANEILTNQFFQGRVGYLHELGQLRPFLGDKIYALAFLEAAKIYGDFLRPNSAPVPLSANGGFVVNTFIGPIFLGGAYGDRGHQKIYFKLGRIF